ncbi:MAG: V-type ATP synthase subunit I [Clostridia bacterium]
MAKIKLANFELVSVLKDSKRVIDYLQKLGVAQLENVENENLKKHNTNHVVSEVQTMFEQCQDALELIEKYAIIKKSLAQKIADYREIDYNEYKNLVTRCEQTLQKVAQINEAQELIEKQEEKIIGAKSSMDYHEAWNSFDLPMCSTRTAKTTIFIGTFDFEVSETKLSSMIQEIEPEIEDVAVEIISSEKMHTCALVMCHNSSAEKINQALFSIGFVKTENPAKKLANQVLQDCIDQIQKSENKITELKNQIAENKVNYQDLKFLSDYLLIQREKYTQLENTAISEKTIYVTGYLPWSMAEEVKFNLESQFLCEFNYHEPDFEQEDVPVLIQNSSFAAGVEGITNLYSSPSNNDIDPNPVMAIFYYLFFGLMLSDAGYGLILVAVGLLARYKFKVIGETKKMADMALFCGISTTFWGAMFGGWFGDLASVVASTFFGVEDFPSLAIWFEPMEDSMTLLLFSFGIGIVHLFVGLGLRCFMLLKKKDYFGAFFDVVPVMVFVCGFAIIGAGMLVEDLPAAISSAGVPLLGIGSLFIVLTSGRSAKNIVGKLGGGLFELYNTISGYLGDILSYSRLLALCLVTGVIANVVNLLAALMGNPIVFIIIFLVGHLANIGINLIGTYVHTNRLQYVEFFSKFYEGAGSTFTPFKLNSKYYIIKEDKINE